MNQHSNKSESGDIDAEAAQWLARRDRGLRPAEQDAFFEWLAADPRRAEAFAKHQQLWSRMNLVADWRPEHADQPNHDLLATPGRSRKLLYFSAVGAGMAACMALALFLIHGMSTSELERPFPAPFAAAVEDRVLPDGSRVELCAGATIQMQFAESSRRVRLLQGEAYFTVAKDDVRPFVVAVDGFEARALGTAFKIQMVGESVELLVTHGRVQVNEASESVSTSARTGPGSPVVVAGQRAVMVRGGGTPPQISTVSSKEIASLFGPRRSKVLDFNDAPLSEVVAEFNRYNGMQLVIVDAELAAMTIGTSFSADNLDGFVRLLESSFGVRAERADTTITLQRAKP